MDEFEERMFKLLLYGPFLCLDSDGDRLFWFWIFGDPTSG